MLLGALAGIGLIATRLDDGDDPAEVVDADSVWGFHPGDVIGYRRPDGLAVRLAVFGVYPPDKTFDYLRVAAVLVDNGGSPSALDLTPVVTGDDDGYVPVGKPAQPMSPGEGIRQAGQVIAAGQSVITPGLVMLVPENAPARAGEPSAAGFYQVSGGRAVAPRDGYARLMSWSGLARRLDTVPAPGR
jgi:hypothetical protein